MPWFGSRFLDRPTNYYRRMMTRQAADHVLNLVFLTRSQPEPEEEPLQVTEVRCFLLLRRDDDVGDDVVLRIERIS